MGRKDFIFELYQNPATVFSTQDIALILRESDRQKLKQKINYYVKRGVLARLRRGIYAKPNYDVLELAIKIYTPSYISLETTLARAGLIFQKYTPIFVVSYLSREIECNGHKIIIRKIKDGILVNPKGLEKDKNYSIATTERAFLDALYLYKDYHFDNLSPLDWEKCFDLAEIYQNKKLKKLLKKYHNLSKQEEKNA